MSMEHTEQIEVGLDSAELLTELDSVRREMMHISGALGSPLSELVVSRIRQAEPVHYAAFVLCAGYTSDQDRVGHRIDLAAALEMLNVALGIHQLLVDATMLTDEEHPAAGERMFIGSTILAGDYCFSHAANLAARTENPTIVALFASALQDVSAGRLRNLLSANANGHPAGSNSIDPILTKSGMAAALELSDLTPQQKKVVFELGLVLAGNSPDEAEKHSSQSRIDALLAQLPSAHQARWRSLIELLSIPVS